MPQQHPNVPQFHALKIRSVFQGSGGPKAAVNDVIDDDEELEEYAESCVQQQDREEILGAKPKPKFEREKVIAVALGERPTAGYEVEIVCATQQTGGFVGIMTIISYVVRSPSGPVAQVITHPHHVVRVKNAGGLITFRQVPDMTTMAVGEEGQQATTLAIGEEEPMMTTMMVGEEGQQATTLEVGEEDPQPRPTTLAIGEESPQPTTLAIGEEGPGPTTLALGEEQTKPTGAFGEHGSGATTLATGEEGPGPTTLATGEEQGGFGGPFGQF